MATESKPARAGRPKREVRPISGREHLIGIGLLCLTMLICTWVLIRGLAPRGVLWGNYDAALFGDQAGVATPAAAPAPETVAEGDDYGEQAAPASAAGAQKTVLPIACEGWTAAEPEVFTAENMWQKINGRADAYIANECVGLECASYTQGEKGLDLYLFQHSDAKQAFAMFRAEKSEGEPVAEVGQEGYLSGTSLYFRQGAYYAQILGVSGQETVEDAMALGLAVAAKLPADTADIPALAWFPADGRDDGSLGYVKDNALGQEWLNDIYTVNYQAGEGTLQAFLTQRKDQAEADALLARYREYLAAMGSIADSEVAGGKQSIGDLSGMFDLVFAKGDYFGGVTYTDDRAGAEALAKRILEQL